MSSSVPHSEQQELGAAQQRRGMRSAYLGQASGILFTMLLMQSAMGTLLIKALGGSDGLAMFFGAFLGYARIAQVPASLIVHPARGKRFLLRCWAVYGVLCAAAVAIPFVLSSGPSTAMVVVVLLCVATLISQLGTTFWFPLLHDVVPTDRRGRFFGMLRATWTSALFVAVVLSGLFLGPGPAIWRYQVVLLLAVGGIFLRNVFVRRIPTAREFLKDQDDFNDWRRHTENLLSRREVVVFITYYCALGFCVGFLAQPLVLYMESLGFKTDGNMIVTSFAVLGSLVSYVVAGRLVDRVGTKRVFLVAHVGLCIACFAAIGIGELPYAAAAILMPALLVFAGAIRAGAGLACTAQLFHLAPDRGRAFFLCLGNVLVFAGPATAPVVAGALLSMVGEDWRMTLAGRDFSIHQVMLAGAGVLLLAGVALLYFVHDVRVRPPTSDKGAAVR